MTRAMERLLVSGSVDSTSTKVESTPIGWVLDRLGLTEAVGEADGPLELERGTATVVLRVDRGISSTEDVRTETTIADSFAAGGQLALFEGAGELLPPLAPRLHELVGVPEPPVHDVRRLSYSAIALHERCGYRYYAERLVGMRPAAWARGTGDGGLHPTEIGDAVHRLLELVDLHGPAVPTDLEERVRAWYPDVRPDELAVVRRHVDAYCTSALAARIATLEGVAVERPFLFALDGVLLNGRLDVLWRDGDRALVLDYKTNALGGLSPAEIVEREYRRQQSVYALACLRAGATEVEVVYHFLESADDPVSTVFGQAEVKALETELVDAITAIRAGVFTPTPSDYACSGCPALDRVCAGPRLLDDPAGIEPYPEQDATAAYSGP
jgi:hypothetical protein